VPPDVAFVVPGDVNPGALTTKTCSTGWSRRRTPLGGGVLSGRLAAPELAVGGDQQLAWRRRSGARSAVA